MASDSSSNQYYHDTDLPEGGDGSFLLSYPYTDIDADRIETPRVFTHLSENAANVDKSNAYFSDYTPLDTNRSETPRNFNFAPTGDCTISPPIENFLTIAALRKPARFSLMFLLVCLGQHEPAFFRSALPRH